MPSQIRFIIRRLLKSPGFTAVTLLTLALGIGANTAIFGVINGILLKPLPFADSDRLASVRLSAPGINLPDLEVAPSLYFLGREESQTMDHFAVWQGDSLSVTGIGEPEEVEAIDTTSELLAALEVAPVVGRPFLSSDDDPKAPKVAVLSYGYWMRKFGGDRNVIGKRIVADAVVREIVGVLPQSFRFLNRNPQILVPLQIDRAKVFVGNFSYDGIARLKPGATWQQANADVARLLPMMMAKFPMPPGFSPGMFEAARIVPQVKPLKERVIGNIGTMLWVLMGTIGMVLFIAGANVANLLLVRAEGRQHELSIRAALGASRGDLARELLAESILLGLVGGAIGLGLADLALRWLIYLAPAGLPRLNEISIDPAVWIFALAVSVIAGATFGLIPVFKYAGPRLNNGLRDGGRGSSVGRERHRARSVLVIVQVALAMVLLIGAGLMIRTFRALTQIDPGFRNPEQVLTLRVGIPEQHVPKVERVVQMYKEMLRKIGEIPGVEAESLGAITMDGQHSGDPLFAEDRQYKEGELPPVRSYKYAAPGLFGTLGTRFIAGRDFTWTDIDQRTPIMILSENLARELWGDPARAVGKRVRERPGGQWREIVGVIGDARDDGMTEPAPKIAFFPVITTNLWDQETMVRRNPFFAIRSRRTGTQSFSMEVQQAIWSVDPALTISQVRTLREIEDQSLARTSFTLVMLAIAGGMAFILGVIGIYGVISYSVSQRTREIGIRTALGATSGELRTMFVRHAFLLAAIGVGAGLAGALAVTGLMSSLLYDVSPRDPLTFGLVPIVLVAAAMAASFLPARRATLVEPIEALRTD
jgi:putative ABC transport system permease protein